MRIKFGIFEIDDETGECFKNDRTVHIQYKTFKLLELLVKSGKFVSYDIIQSTLWPDVNIDFRHGIKECAHRLRSIGIKLECFRNRGYRLEI